MSDTTSTQTTREAPPQVPRFGHSLTVFFPAYNDAGALPRLLEDTFAVLEQAADEFEVIVVNDGSQDDTAEVLRAQQQRFPSLRVVTHAVNRGYGAAVRSGFAAARGEFVFYTDGDAQYEIRELAGLLARATEGVDWVNGYKKCRQDPWYRRAVGAVYNQTVRLLFSVRLRDVDCDFRLIRRSRLTQFPLTSTSGTFGIELARRLEESGLRAVEVAVSHYPRQHGQSQFFRWRSLRRTAQELLQLYKALILLPSAPYPADGRSTV